MKKLIAIILCSLVFAGTAQARTNWRFYVGGMYAKGFPESHNHSSKNKEIYLVDVTKDYDMYTFWAGMDIQFFIKDKFIIETGLNYRMAPYAHFETDDHNTITINGKKYKEEWLHQSTWGNFASIPLRFGYHLTLNRKNSLEFCVGPYAAVSFTCTKHIFVGISPVITYKHRAFSVSLHYENPIFYNGSNSHLGGQLAVTIGVNFGGRKPNWDNILTGLEIAGSVLSATSSAISAYQGSSSDYSSSSSSSTSSTKSKQNSDNNFSLSEQQNYNTDKSTYSRYESQLSKHFYGSGSMSKQEVQNCQKAMKKLREKWESKGKSFPHSALENRSY